MKVGVLVALTMIYIIWHGYSQATRGRLLFLSPSRWADRCNGGHWLMGLDLTVLSIRLLWSFRHCD